MQFLYPIGLLAIAGLIIPLIIHLWNVKQGKTLKIGSIALLGESSRASSKSFKVNDWLLLILRCLLLILVACIIAQPFLKKSLTGKANGWILVEKSKFQTVFKNNKNKIDSLLKLGYEMHDFNPGFTTLTLKDTANIDSAKQNAISYTALLNQLNTIIPTGNSVYLFANHRLNAIGNELPRISYKLFRNPINETDTLGNWITDYAGKKYEAKSNPSSTVYTAIASKDVPAIRVSIYESAGNSDRNYLNSALKAIASFSRRRIEINPAGKVDVGFWLSDEAVSSAFKSSITSGGTLFRYEKGKIIPEASFIVIDGKNITSSRRIEAKKTLETIWADGFGNSILSAEKQNNLNILHFYSRLNPQWSQLVWNETFVKAIMPIVIQDNKSSNFGFEDNDADQRQLAKNQKETIQISKTEKTTQNTQNKQLHNIFWIIAFLIFLTERILTFSKKTANYVKN
ncbi:BatA domain-containing protein [Pedobacter jejuensis]|uniref:BatA domain-containing protein n=1 Tax=Pedobacter jejuensis TaxID=1268550 RepID=UPI00142E5953|nr:BatA domain-containing protein [Pedobacter jejuensis]